MKEQVRREMLAAIDAALSKKAENLLILEMDRSSGAFTDHFIICSGSNPRQMQSIADEVELEVKHQTGTYAHQVEGYREAEWVLVDFIDFVVHIFSEERRAFYGLERLWRSAKILSVEEFRAQPSIEEPSVTPSTPTKKSAVKTARSAKAPATRTAAKTSSRRAPKKAVKTKKAKSNRR